MSALSRPQQLSVAMIARDEQAVIAETLDSIRGIADEILVLDTGSTDQTAMVAAEWGAKVFHAPWSHDFSVARNQLLEEFQGDWVLWLDAGERLAPGSAELLRQFIDAKADRKTLYNVVVEVPAPSASYYAEQAAQARLMPAGAGIRFEGPVGESLRPSAETAQLQLAQAPGKILCHPRRNDPKRRTEIALRDLRIIARYRGQGNPLTPRVLVRLGEAYCQLKQPVLAEQAFLQAVRTARRGSSEMLEGYYGLLTAMAADPTQLDRQLLACTEALEVYPLDAQLLCTAGGYLQARGRLDLAERSFRLAVQFGQIHTDTWHLVGLGDFAVACLSASLQLQGKDDEARDVLEQAVLRPQMSPRLGRQLVELHVKHGRVDEALRVAESLFSQAEMRRGMEKAVRGACKATRQQWTEAIADLQQARAAGCDDPLCLRWLSAALISAGRLEAAEPVVRQWQQAEPENHEMLTYLRLLEYRPRSSDGGPSDGQAARERTRRRRFDSPASRPTAAESAAPPIAREPAPEAGTTG